MWALPSVILYKHPSAAITAILASNHKYLSSLFPIADETDLGDGFAKGGVLDTIGDCVSCDASDTSESDRGDCGRWLVSLLPADTLFVSAAFGD